MLIRPLRQADRPTVRSFIEESWGLPVVSVSGCHDPSELDGFVAEEGPDRLGLLTYRLDQVGCEVVTLDSIREGCGVGSALLEHAYDHVAVPAGVRLWLITTNDNLNAIGFYQRRGMDLVRLHKNFVDVVAHHKDIAPRLNARIRFRHALEFERLVDPERTAGSGEGRGKRTRSVCP